MKTLPNQTASESAPEKANPTTSRFIGTENPRHIRAIDALMTGPRSREELDATVGCSNGPQLVAELRRLGLNVPCKLVAGNDRDGRTVRWGEYHFTTEDRSEVTGWLRRQDDGNSGSHDGA